MTLNCSCLKVHFNSVFAFLDHTNCLAVASSRGFDTNCTKPLPKALGPRNA